MPAGAEGRPARALRVPATIAKSSAGRWSASRTWMSRRCRTPRPRHDGRRHVQHFLGANARYYHTLGTAGTVARASPRPPQPRPRRRRPWRPPVAKRIRARQTGQPQQDCHRGCLWRWRQMEGRPVVHLMDNIMPKLIPFSPDLRRRFLHGGEHHHKAGHVPDEVRARRQDRWKNEWGFVVRLDDEVWYAYGRVPKSFLKLFAARQAFIYVLEIFALQLVAAIVFAKRLPQLWIA